MTDLGSFCLLLHTQSERLKQVQDHLCTLHSICVVLGVDFLQVLSEVNASLADPERPKDISDATIEQLVSLIKKLREVKLQRMQKVAAFCNFI